MFICKIHPYAVWIIDNFLLGSEVRQNFMNVNNQKAVQFIRLIMVFYVQKKE